MDAMITERGLLAFAAQLRARELAAGTIEKYVRDVRALGRWLQGRALSTQTVRGWKEALLAQGYAARTVNSMLAAVLRYCRAARLAVEVRFLKVQRRAFCTPERELTRAEYSRLLAAAQRRGQTRLALLMQTMAGTGIRVSEVPYITVEAVRQGRAEIQLKGKIRTILLPDRLRRKLEDYARAQKIHTGEIFLTRAGKGLSRKQIWAELKRLCDAAGVAPGKVFPHNLRHLFAVTFYSACRDVVKLADVLGHASVETTRIYLRSSGTEHRKLLSSLRLVE